MWLLYAVASALFAGATSILAKCGIKRTDSNLATALRTGVVLICAWGMVFLTGAQTGLRSIDTHSLILLILSGLATEAPGFAISARCHLAVCRMWYPSISSAAC